MGIFLPCPLPCENSIYINNNNNNKNKNSENENNSSLYSQPSLPSVPSLQLHHQTKNDVVFQSVKTLSAHSSYISALVLAGDFLFSSSSDGTVRLWPPNHHRSTTSSVVVVSNSSVKSLIVSGDKLFTAHQDHKVRVWKITENDDKETQNDSNENEPYKCVATLPTLNDRLSRMFSSKNYVAVRRHKKRTWVHHNDAVSALASSKDGSTLYTASWDRSFKVWRASDFRCVESVPDAHDDAVNAIALTDDGLVFTGSADKKIKVWERRISEEGRIGHFLVQTLEKHRSAVNALAVRTDSRVLYSGACDRSILVWENVTNNNNKINMVVVGALRGHNKAILSLSVVGDIVCSGSADCTIRVWKRAGFDNKTYACLAVLEGHRRPVKCLSLALDNNDNSIISANGSSYLIYSGGLDCEIRVWKILVPSSYF